MEEKEFLDKVKIINENRDEEYEKLCSEYVLSISLYKVGDIIQSRYHIIEIKRIGTVLPDFDYTIPDCIYFGTQLDNDLSISKEQANTIMYQSNVKRLLTPNSER